MHSIFSLEPFRRDRNGNPKPVKYLFASRHISLAANSHPQESKENVTRLREHADGDLLASVLCLFCLGLGGVGVVSVMPLQGFWDLHK